MAVFVRKKITIKYFPPNPLAQLYNLPAPATSNGYIFSLAGEDSPTASTTKVLVLYKSEFSFPVFVVKSICALSLY